MVQRKNQTNIDLQAELTEGERDLRRKIEIVIGVFKKSADKLSRVDREW